MTAEATPAGGGCPPAAATGTSSIRQPRSSERRPRSEVVGRRPEHLKGNKRRRMERTLRYHSGVPPKPCLFASTSPPVRMAPTHIKLITKRSPKAFAEVRTAAAVRGALPRSMHMREHALASNSRTSASDQPGRRRRSGRGEEPPLGGGEHSHGRHEAAAVWTQPGSHSPAARLASHAPSQWVMIDKQTNIRVGSCGVTYGAHHASGSSEETDLTSSQPCRRR